MLRINGLKVVRGEFTVSLPEITVANGECVALCGVSGSGKSTLMEAIALLTPPLEVGSFIIDGVAIDELNEKQRQAVRVSGIGIMPQTGGLLPYLTIKENLELQIRMALRQQVTAIFDREVSAETTNKSKPSAIDSASASSLNTVPKDKSAISIDGFATKVRSLTEDEEIEVDGDADLTDEERKRVRRAAAQLSIPADSFDSQSARQFTSKRKRKLSAESLVHAELTPQESTTNHIVVRNQENSARIKELMEFLEKYIDKMGLQAHMHKLPEQLSIGQRQRALFLRAIAHKPRLLLIDEPTSALDPENASNLFQIIDEIAKDSGISILLITHDLKAASRYTRYVYDEAKSHSEYSVFTFYDDSNSCDIDIHNFYSGRPLDYPSAPHIYSSQFADRSVKTFHSSYSNSAGASHMASSGVTLTPMHSSNLSRIGGFTTAIKTEAGSTQPVSNEPQGIEILYDELGHLYSAQGRITYYTTPADKLKSKPQPQVDDHALTSSKRGGSRPDAAASASTASATAAGPAGATGHAAPATASAAMSGPDHADHASATMGLGGFKVPSSRSIIGSTERASDSNSLGSTSSSANME